MRTSGVTYVDGSERSFSGCLLGGRRGLLLRGGRGLRLGLGLLVRLGRRVPRRQVALLLGDLLLLLGLLLGLLLVGRLRLGLGLRRGAVAGPDDGELGADLDGLVLLDLDLLQRARHGGGDLGVDLVGGDLEQRLVDRDLVADLLEPAGDRALGDRLAQRGQCHRRTATATAAGGLPGVTGVLLLGSRLLLGGRLTAGVLLLGLLLGPLLLDVLAASGAVLLAGVLFLAARLVGGARVAGRLALVADHGQDGTDLDRVVLVGLDLQQRAGDGGGDLGVDLVGGDLQQRLVDRDGVADLLQPAGDGAFGDGLPECREGDFGGQWTSFALGRICVVVCDQVWACSGLPASARWASPRASCWVGWAWTRGATSSGWASQP